MEGWRDQATVSFSSSQVDGPACGKNNPVEVVSQLFHGALGGSTLAKSQGRRVEIDRKGAFRRFGRKALCWRSPKPFGPFCPFGRQVNFGPKGLISAERASFGRKKYFRAENYSFGHICYSFWVRTLNHYDCRFMLNQDQNLLQSSREK